MSALRKYRDDTETTLEQIGAKIGVHKSTVLRWEEKKIPAERVHQISRVTGIPPRDLRPDLFGSARWRAA